MTRRTRKKVAILISGRGSNMAALIAAAIDPSFPAEIVGVISNRADARGLEVAATHSIPTTVVSSRDYDGREAHDAAIHKALTEFKAEIVCLAGYMRLLTPDFVQKWKGRMINIHPALLPSFRGLDTHARALATGVRVHGCTVHFVTPEMDEGPIIAQAAVPVLTGDTEETLGERVLKVEHRLYPLALRLLAEGRVRMSDGVAVFSGVEDEHRDIAIISPGERRD
ncbi:phosphoribosylglycinamide formyltransferase [Nitratireductor sp. L1-7-SE]|uniref:Phosphoribosylglycinamide formyltransferase n=1 Tax=Nitratireductor rhodophyticola TaxID=2854036 RepID=A0ABS7RCR0_9HYPH|nr:phosphoribosylglycinamide formyltransferase [Nitratireductor rhodophyticola]MBY8918716.1 phosphoribosylglycinamide formyltransferase [Nitratireductor rhodophyticola]MBY8920100.1 phosphoribosylglycinamide formyltransferase [Nitratireductor rhodophyticola]